MTNVSCANTPVAWMCALWIAFTKANPDECIDCGVCEPECPEEAIIPDSQDDGGKWLELNTKFSNIWPVITEVKEPMPDYEKHSGEQDKLTKYFKDK